VYPKVITDGLDVFQNQRWLAAVERKLPQPLCSISFDANDGNIFSSGHQRWRVFTFRRVRDLRGGAAANVITINVGLLVSNRSVKNATTVRQERRLIVIADEGRDLERLAKLHPASLVLNVHDEDVAEARRRSRRR